MSGKFSDLTVVHGARKWCVSLVPKALTYSTNLNAPVLTQSLCRKAHKVVVASQSSVLEEMIEQLQDAAILHLTKYDHAAVISMSTLCPWIF